MKPPPGFRLRRPLSGDAGRVAALVRAVEAAEGAAPETEAEDVAFDFASLDLERDAWLVEADGGRLAGYVMVDRHRAGRVRSDGYVHPDFAGRGLGSLLVRLAERRAGELVAADPQSGRVLLHNGVLETNAAATTLLRSEGYRPVRWFRRMLVELEAEPVPGPPDGIVLRAFEPDREARAFHAAREEALEDHWDHGPLPFEAWRERRLAAPGFDPTLWFVAADGEEIAGVAECRWKVLGKGFVELLAVRRAWRSRGIGLALLLRCFAEFHRRGERRVFLYVDADSPTGANRLYERAGMRADWSAEVYEKELRPGAVPVPARDVR